MDEMAKKQQRIYDLMSELYSSVSSIGDWKVIKIYEARMQGKEDPYDFDELIAKRQAVRDEINALQKELEAAGE